MYFNLIYSYLFREKSETFFVPAADQSKIMQEQMSGAAMAMPPDPKAAFKAEWEALEITEHKWALSTVETDLLTKTEKAQWAGRGLDSIVDDMAMLSLEYIL